MISAKQNVFYIRTLPFCCKTLRLNQIAADFCMNIGIMYELSLAPRRSVRRLLCMTCTEF